MRKFKGTMRKFKGEESYIFYQLNHVSHESYTWGTPRALKHSTEVIRTFCGYSGNSNLKKVPGAITCRGEGPRARNQCPLTTFYSSETTKQAHRPNLKHIRGIPGRGR